MALNYKSFVYRCYDRYWAMGKDEVRPIIVTIDDKITSPPPFNVQLLE